MMRLICDPIGFQRIIFAGECSEHPGAQIVFGPDGYTRCAACDGEIAWRARSAFAEIVAHNQEAAELRQKALDKIRAEVEGKL